MRLQARRQPMAPDHRLVRSYLRDLDVALRPLPHDQARELSEQEVANVTGGFRTLTVCTFFNGKVDGDTGEC